MTQLTTPVEKIRRRHWHRHSCFLIWTFRCGKYRNDNDFEFEVEVDGSDANGWRYFVRCRRDLLTRSEPLATAQLAAVGGISYAEMLMADPLWVAADCEAEVEGRVARAAERAALFELRNERSR
jgi:hypothetical protein